MSILPSTQNTPCTIADQYFDAINLFEESKYSSLKSNKKGVVYTHKNTAREMVDLISPRLQETIWEPSAGAGVFVIAIIEYIVNNYYPSSNTLRNYIETKLFFTDVDQEALDFTVKNVQSFLSKEYGLENVKFQYQNKDALLNTKCYNIIIGNPPYIRTKNLDTEYLSFLRENFNFCKKGNIDLYYAFIELAHKYANRSCLITPNSFINNKSAKELRGTIAANITHLRDHKELKQFNNASTYTVILTMSKEAKNEFQFAEYDKEYSLITRDKLYQSNWHLNSYGLVYKNRNTKFSNVMKLSAGIATNADQAYLVKPSSLTGNYYTKEYNGIKYLIEAKLCISIKKLSKYFGKNKKDDKMIIFPYININEIMEEEYLINKYPFAYKYLLAIKEDILDKRDKGKVTAYDAWYAYGRRQGFNIDFTGKKCFLIPLVYKEDNFVFEEIVPNKRFVHSSGFVIVANERYENNILEILKSSDFYNYLKLHGTKMPGKDINYNRISSTILKNYPYLSSVSSECRYTATWPLEH